MPSTGANIIIGFLSLTALSVSLYNIDNKDYKRGDYYYSDNTHKPVYTVKTQTQIQEMQSEYFIPESEIILKESPDTLTQPIMWDTSKNLVNFFQATTTKEPLLANGKEFTSYTMIEGLNEVTFAFNEETKIYSPMNCYILSISPNIKNGLIPDFSSYFSGISTGVTMVTEGVLNGTDGIGYTVQITYSNLARTYQAFNHSDIEAVREYSTGNKLYYSECNSPIDVNKGAAICSAGTTGSKTKVLDKKNYVTIKLMYKPLNSSGNYKNITFGELAKLSG